MSKKYIEFFQESIKKYQTKDTYQLENDFSSIIYLTTSYQRKKEIEIKIASEIKNTNISIIPPLILEWKEGIEKIAIESFSTSLSKSLEIRNNTLLFDLYIYQKVWNYFKDNETKLNFYSSLVHPQNFYSVSNMVYDFKYFMETIFENELEETIEKLINDLSIHKSDFKEELDKISFDESKKNTEFLLNVYKEYTNDINNFEKENEDSQFFDRYHIIKKFKKSTLSSEKFKKIIIAEDTDTTNIDSPPLYINTIKMLESKNYPILKANSSLFRDYQDPPNKTTEIKGFITSLDEAEYIAHQITEIIEKDKNPEGEIAIISFNTETLKILPSVFKRYNLIHFTPTPIENTKAFKIIKSLVNIFLSDEINITKLYETLTSSSSKFKLNNNTIVLNNKKDFREILYEASKIYEINRSGNENKNIFQIILEISNLNNEDKETINKLSEEIKSLNNKIPENFLIEKIIKNINELKEEEDVIIKLASYFEEADKIINNINDYELKKVLINSLISFLGKIKYYPGEIEIENFFIPIFEPENLKNTAAKYIFICGLNSDADSIKKYPIPKILIEKLNLKEKLNKKNSQIYKSILEIINSQNNINLTLSYSYYNLSGDVSGVSNLINIINEENKDKITNDYKLKSILDIIKSSNKTSDISYISFSSDQKNNDDIFQSIKNIKIIDLLKLKNKIDNTNLKIHISVYNFLDIINCPTKFLYNLILNLSSIKYDVSPENKNAIKKGTFWHSVFTNASKNENFYSKDENKIIEAIESSLNNELNNIKSERPEVFEEIDKNSFLNQVKPFIKIFAINEKERQKKLSYEPKSIENSLSTEIFKIDEIPVYLDGRIDRIDSFQDNIYIWDYKTGKKTPLSFEGRKYIFSSSSKNFQQLILYSYLFKKNNNTTKKINCFNIFMDGSDNSKNGNYNNYDNVAKGIEIMEKIYIPILKQIFKLYISDFFYPQNIESSNETYQIKKSNNNESRNIFSINCVYCDFKDLCKMIKYYNNTEVKNA